MCRYEMYPNPSYLERTGLTKVDFDRLCKMTSWAICGQRTVTDDAQHLLLPDEEKEDETG